MIASYIIEAGMALTGNIESRNDPVPEDKDEEHEKHAERGHIVHGLHQDHQLAAQSWHEADQLQHAKQPECSEHRQTPI